MIAPARVAAHRGLRLVNEGRTDLATVLARVRGWLADERDRALAAEIVTGTIRWQALLDWAIDRRLDRAPHRLDAAVRDVLRAGVYQLRHLDRVPSHAAVSDAVSLTREIGKPAAAGLVNALLRRVAREDDRTSTPPHPGPRPPAGSTEEAAWRVRALDYLSVSWSHPRWLVGRWLDRYGFEGAEAWVSFNNSPAPITLRANRLKTSRDALARHLAEERIVVGPTKYAPDGLVVTAGAPLASPLWTEGVFTVQDEASQLVPLAIVPDTGSLLLDACAAPGGKTTQWAGLAPGAHIVACDVRPPRLRLLRRTVEASGAEHIRIVAADLAAGLPFGPVFDVVAVDAPCSGLGTIRRDPDIKWRRQPEDLNTLSDRQVTMLQRAAEAVRPGGHLLYSTCSSEPEENQEVVARFLETSPSFTAIPLPLVGSALPPQVVNADGALETTPHLHGLDAFFGTLLGRRR